MQADGRVFLCKFSSIYQTVMMHLKNRFHHLLSQCSNTWKTAHSSWSGFIRAKLASLSNFDFRVMNFNPGRIWAFLNSAVGIWLLTSIIGGVGVWQFERYLDARDRQRVWLEAVEHLSLEYGGRLSQYSAWFMTLIKNPEVSPSKYEFKSCVTPNYLRWSIKVLSGKPNYSNVDPRKDVNDCDGFPRFQAIFDEYSEKSTLGVLIELRSIDAKLYPETWKVDPEYGVLVPDKNADSYEFRTRVLTAINDFLNPDAVIPLRFKTQQNFTINDFRKAFMDSFYGIGSDDFWYADIFAG